MLWCHPRGVCSKTRSGTCALQVKLHAHTDVKHRTTEWKDFLLPPVLLVLCTPQKKKKQNKRTCCNICDRNIVQVGTCCILLCGKKTKVLIWQIWWGPTRLRSAEGSNVQLQSFTLLSLHPFLLHSSTSPSLSPLWVGVSTSEGAKKGFLHAVVEARCVSNLRGGWDDGGGRGRRVGVGGGGQ